MTELITGEDDAVKGGLFGHVYRDRFCFIGDALTFGPSREVYNLTKGGSFCLYNLSTFDLNRLIRISPRKDLTPDEAHALALYEHRTRNESLLAQAAAGDEIFNGKGHPDPVTA